MRMRRVCLLLAAMLGLLTVRMETGAAEAIGEPPLPPGEHPRLLFHGREIGALRSRAATPVGQGLAGTLRREAHGHREAWVKKLAARDTEWLEQMRNETGVLGKFNKQCWHAALLYVASGEERDGLVAVEMFRIWMSAWPATEEIEATESWGNPWAAMTYDWLHELLTEADRAKARRILASMVGAPTLDAVGKRWWNGGPTPSGRCTTNWTPIYAASLGMTLLAIEGQDGYNEELLALCISLVREYLDGGISPDGAMYEGLGYASGYGTKDIPYFLHALERRGVTFWRDTHLPKLSTWLSYELLPWGYEGFPLNQSNGNLGSGELLTFLTQEQGGLNRWIFKNVTGRRENDLRIDAGVGLINGWASWRGERPDELPLSHWFSNRGLVFSRSGWGERDASFVFNSNPMGAGHTHADQGHFCLASHGAAFFLEGGVSKFDSEYHNVVLIDGRGQASSQSRVDAFLRSADLSAYADVMDIDQKLAYDRVLQGENDFEWVEYNPVERAERQALFVRGATGPFVVIADALRKDAEPHRFDWLGHVPWHNPVRVDGRTFRIEERFGGKFLQAIDAGKMSAMEATGLRNGTVRGWVLVRSLPHIAAWSSNTLRVNGRAAPYNTSYFGLGFHYRGWYWNSILPEKVAEIPITDGKLRFEVESGSGGRVALAVFTYDPTWEPGDTIPANGGDFVVLTVDDLVETEAPWEILEAPKGVLDGAFLGAAAPEVTVAQHPRAETRVITARKETVDADFLAVMAPHDDGDGRTLELKEWGAATAAVLTGAGGVDLISGPADGRLATDGAAASLSLNPDETIVGYALVRGTRLAFEGRELLSSTVPLHAVYDGKQLILRAARHGTVKIWRGSAGEVVVNGARSRLPAGEMVTIEIPALATEWTTAISADGRTATASGDGPQPLWIEAPATVREVIVNGISRWFIRDADGQRVSPALETGSPFPYAGELTAAELFESLVEGSAAQLGDQRELNPTGVSGEAVIAPAGKLTMDLPIVGPGAYRLVVLYMAGAPVELRIVEPGGERSVVATPESAGVQRLAVKDVMLRESPARLTFTGSGKLALVAIRLQPQYRDLAANVWSTIGPFPSPYTRQNATDAAVKAALEAVYPPEREIDLDAKYEGSDGRQVRWQQDESLAGAGMRDGVNFKVRNGVLMSEISYAVTWVNVPTERQAEVSMNCDYWANLYVNGVLIESNRDPNEVAQDGAWFKGLKRFTARFSLQKGQNTIMVETHGGMGGSSFAAAITDPGDLQFTPTP